jgi:photosystem II stability/assembly factor-like uncharacterized protein
MQRFIFLYLFLLLGAFPAFGQTFWHEVNSAPFVETINTCIAVHPGTDTIFIGTASRGIFRSADNGATWQNVYGTDSVIFSLFIRNDGLIIAGGRGCVYRSADNGTTWARHPFAGSHPVTDVLFSPDGDIFLGTGDIESRGEIGVDVGDGVFLSQDGGVTWTQKNTGLRGSLAVTALARMRSGEIVVATSSWNYQPFTGGLYYSNDGGEHWQFHHILIDGKNTVPDSMDVRSIDAMVVDAQGRLVISMRGIGYAWDAQNPSACEFVAVTSDMGATWDILSAVPTSTFWMQATPRSLYVDQMGGLWCSISGGNARGIFCSSDNGEQWRQRISGLSRSQTGLYEKVFFAQQNNGILYAIQEFDSHIYRAESLATGIRQPLSGMVSLSVMPNPVRENFGVARFSLGHRASVRLILTDITGAEQVVATGEYGPGEQTIPLRLERYVSGSYQLALEVDGVRAGTVTCGVVR